MLIHDGKFDIWDDPILHHFSQITSTSFKYDYVPDALIIMQGSWKFKYNSGMAKYVASWCQIWYQRWSNPPKLMSGAISILQVWLCSWCTFNHDRDMKIGIKLMNDKIYWFIMSHFILDTIKSSKTPVRNHPRPPSMTVFSMLF